MHTLIISGYKFTALTNLITLKNMLFDACNRYSLKGTILLSEEGTNINLAGLPSNITEFKAFLSQTVNFSDVSFKENVTNVQPFKRLKIKLKKEIITLRQAEVDVIKTRATSLSPIKLKQWLDEEKDFLLLDTRNDYEIQFGTFKKAVNLHIKKFTQFPNAIAHIPTNKKIVMFCTGGIRCEKAALYMQQVGFSTIYQLEGGILNYFEKAGGAHYEGKCYVFDERLVVGPPLEKISDSS